MTERLTEKRFAELADAYGGEIARWPASVRAQARELAKSPGVQAVLAEAEWIDSKLDRWKVPAPTPALAARIIDTRPAPAISRRARLWWSGIGIATALAGAGAGSVAAATALPGSHTMSDDATAFGVLGQEN
ncbi:hypothetical protein [Sphingomonas oryzagri]